MSKRVCGGLALLLAVTLMVSGCQSEENRPAGADYRDHFTEEEKGEGKAAFDLMKDVRVDARVTPVEKYKNGLKKYYMETYREKKGKRNKEDFIKDPYLYGKKYSKVQEMVVAEMEADFTDKKEIDKNSLSLLHTMKKKDGSNYSFFSTWGKAGDWPDDGGKINTPYMYVDSPDIPSDEAVNTAYNVILCDDEYDKAEIPFINDKEAMAEHLREFLQKLLGRKLYEEWDCVPVTEETIGNVNRFLGLTPESEEYRQLPAKEYCLFRYNVDVDGLPFMSTSLSYHLKEGETASPMTRMGAASANSSTLAGLGEREQTVVVTEDGIEGLDTSYIRGPGKVYKDRAKVLDPDQILSKVQEYYGRQVITSPVTITGISLVYMGYFTDGSEGEIQATIAPFWLVNTVDGTPYGGMAFIYDAFTGEMVE